MEEISEGEEELLKFKGRSKGYYYPEVGDGPYKPAVIEGYKMPLVGVKGGAHWPASVPPVPMGNHFPLNVAKSLRANEPIEEDVESEDAEEEEEEEYEEKYVRKEDEDVVDEGEAQSENESEADSGYTLSQETARFNLQQLPAAQQLGIQMFSPDRVHLLPPRPGAPPPPPPPQFPRSGYPPVGPYPPPVPLGYPQQQMFPPAGHPGYGPPGMFQGPYPPPPVGYTGHPPQRYPGSLGRVPAKPGEPQPLKSISQGSISISQHTRSYASMHSQSQGSFHDGTAAEAAAAAESMSPVRHSSSRVSRDAAAPLINGVPYAAPLANYHPGAPGFDDANSGFIDATMGKYQQWYQHYYGMRHGGTYRRLSRGALYPTRPVEIAHLSMSMLRGGVRGSGGARPSMSPTHVRKFTVPSHNLSERYREKRDVVKENNLRNAHAQHGGEVFDPTPRVIELREGDGEHRSAGRDQRDGDEGEDDAEAPFPADEGQGSNPREGGSESGRILSRPQSARSVIRSNSHSSAKEEQRSRRSSRSGSERRRPSSAADRASGSRTEEKRPSSAHSGSRSQRDPQRRPSEAWSEGRQGGAAGSEGARPPSAGSNRSHGSRKSKSGSRRSSAKSGSRREGSGSRRSSRRGSRERPVSGQSNGSNPNGNNNNRGTARSEPASEGSVPPLEIAAAPVGTVETKVVSGRIDIGDEHHSTAGSPREISEGIGGITADGSRLSKDKGGEDEEVVDGTKLTEGWETLQGEEAEERESAQEETAGSREEQGTSAGEGGSRKTEGPDTAEDQVVAETQHTTSGRQLETLYESDGAGSEENSDTAAETPQEEIALEQSEVFSENVGDQSRAPEQESKVVSERPPSRQETERRPVSGRAAPLPGTARSVQGRPDSARSARSVRNRPVSARSVKSHVSGIEYIDNLSRKSSVHISSEFKNNALKNQGYEAGAEESEEGPRGEEGETLREEEGERGSEADSRPSAVPAVLNNGSLPALRGEVEGREGDAGNPSAGQPVAQ